MTYNMPSNDNGGMADLLAAETDHDAPFARLGNFIGEKSMKKGYNGYIESEGGERNAMTTESEKAALEAKFTHIDNKFERLESKIDAKFDKFIDSFSNFKIDIIKQIHVIDSSLSEKIHALDKSLSEKISERPTKIEMKESFKFYFGLGIAIITVIVAAVGSFACWYDGHYHPSDIPPAVTSSK